MAPPSVGRRGRKRKKVAHYSDDNPSTFTTKVKHGTSVAESSSLEKKKKAPPKRHDNDDTTTSTCYSRKRPLEQQKHQKEDDDTMTCHEHDMRLHSILPENLLPDDSQKNLDDVIFGKGLGPFPPLPKPEWQMVSTPHMTSDKVAAAKNKKLPPPRLLCMGVSSDEKYMVVGNSLGQVLVYALVPLVIHVATLQTTASRRPALKFKKKNEANAIHCISMASPQYVVFSSIQEVECYNLVTQEKCWTLPISSNVCITKLDIHPTNNTVLASVVYNNDTNGEKQSPLWLISGNQTDDDDNDNVRVQKDVLPSSNNNILKCAAMWDRSNSERMLVVTTSHNDETPQELLLMDCSSSILHKATLAVIRTTKSIESISQSSHGMYTCVASSKGIRLYKTATLELIHTYGEGLALHGHGVAYQQACLFSPNVPEEQYANGNGGVLVIGIPHARREPRELQDQLQVWQWWDSIHPSLTFAGPARSLGLAQVWTCSSQSYILALTHAGDVWMFSPTATTDWPGVMYPPGYHTITDNLMYIEDEDELDTVVVEEEPHDEQDEIMLDDELAEALRQSMLETTAVQQEEHVVVSLPKHEQQNVVIPCHPDPALKEIVERNATVSSPKRRRGTTDDELPECFLRQVLKIMPTRKRATRAKEQPRVKVLEATASSSSLSCASGKATRGKRSRAGNLEAMIRASINPELQKFMTSKESWADESGSTLREYDKVQQLKAALSTQGATKTAVAKENATVVSGNAAATDAAAAIEKTPGGVAQQSQTSLFVNEESSNGGVVNDKAKSSISPHGFGKVVEEATKKALQEVAASRPMDDAATFALEGMLALSEENSPRKSNASPTSRVPPVPDFGSVLTTTDADVVVNSPAADTNAAQDAPKSAQSTEIGKNDAFSGRRAETLSPQANATPSSTNAKVVVTVETVTSTNPTSDQNRVSVRSAEAEHVVSHSEGSSLVSSGDGKEDVGTQNSQTVVSSVKPSPLCTACRGRMVIHTCGKREVPVDQEAIERAEKERLEKEEAEKKKQRAEKRRQADAKRREAKKKKKLEEERQKRIEEERRRAEEEAMERSRREAEARLLGDHAERDRRRAEMWQRLMAANGGNRQDEGNASYRQSYEQQPVVNYMSQQERAPRGSQPTVLGPDGKPVVNQGMYTSQQEQALNGAAPGPALYSRSSPVQCSNYPSSNAEAPPGQIAEGSAYAAGYQQQQQQQSVSVTHKVAAPAASQVAESSEQPRGVTDEQSQYDYQQRNDDQAPPRTGLLERRTSAQLGTAEALASLASMCEQMPRAPTPKEGDPVDSQAESLARTPTEQSQPAAPTYSSSQPLGTLDSESSVGADTNGSNVNVGSNTPSFAATAGSSQPVAPVNPPQPLGSTQKAVTQHDVNDVSHANNDSSTYPLAMLAEQSQALASRHVENNSPKDASLLQPEVSPKQSLPLSSGRAAPVLNRYGSFVETTEPSPQDAPAKVTPLFSQAVTTSSMNGERDGDDSAQTDCLAHQVLSPAVSTTVGSGNNENKQAQ